MTDQELQQWFQAIWLHREEHIYPAFFGDLLQRTTATHVQRRVEVPALLVRAR